MTNANIAPSQRARHTRQLVRRNAEAMGIDHAYISILVETFYTRVRAHESLGPIFGAAISNWPMHLGTMKRFWASVALCSGEYSSKPVPAHRKHIDSITREHFDAWLALFRQTLDDTAATTEARDYFMVRAERIAQSLQLAMFGAPEIGAPRCG